MPHSTKEKRDAYLRRYYTPARRALAAAQSRQWYKENRSRARIARSKYRATHVDKNMKERHRLYVDRNGGVRALKLLQRYGISLGEFEMLLDAQGGVCQLCAGHMKRMCINRASETAPITGFVCSSCLVKLRHWS